MKHKSVLLALFASISFETGTLAYADTSENGLDYTSPYINPQQKCLTDGMINPEGKDFRYLYSRDCRVVHVLPPPVMPQAIKSQGVNLAACESMKTVRSTVQTISKTIDEAEQRIRRLEGELDKASSNRKKEISADLDALKIRLEGYKKNLEQTEAYFDKRYGQTPGAIFSIRMDNTISQNDLVLLRGLNISNLLHRRTIIENGKTTEAVEVSTLRPAQLSQSLFSFIYKLPEDTVKNGGVVSTDIPNLEFLEQPGGSHKGVIHVRANGGVTGKVLLSLQAVCDQTKVNESGHLVLDDSIDPFFTVNQTFAVQQMFAQGYIAKLKIDKVVEQITRAVTTHTDHGFKKSAAFGSMIRSKIDEILEFNWTTEFDSGKTISMDKVFEIKSGVAAKLVDDYIENLTKAGVITVIPDSPTKPNEGGYVDEVRTANRCWTERDGGLSGVFGGRHKVCADYNYTVKVWRDGITEEEIKRALDLKVESVDSMSINTMAPFYFTTTFSNSK